MLKCCWFDVLFFATSEASTTGSYIFPIKVHMWNSSYWYFYYDINCSITLYQYRRQASGLLFGVFSNRTPNREKKNQSRRFFILYTTPIVCWFSKREVLVLVKNRIIEHRLSCPPSWYRRLHRRVGPPYRTLPINVSNNLRIIVALHHVNKRFSSFRFGFVIPNRAHGRRLYVYNDDVVHNGTTTARHRRCTSPSRSHPIARAATTSRRGPCTSVVRWPRVRDCTSVRPHAVGFSCAGTRRRRPTAERNQQPHFTCRFRPVLLAALMRACLVCGSEYSLQCSLDPDRRTGT